MDAYFKGRALSDDYFDKSTYHARLSILYGHCTGYAELRLAKNLEKTQHFHKALQLYNLILNDVRFHFRRSGMGNSVDFIKRRDNVICKLSKAKDCENDVLFSPKELQIIYQNVRKNDEKERADDEFLKSHGYV